MKNKYSIKDLKKITNEIVKEEKQKYDLDVDVFPITFIEYYTDYLFKGNFSLKKGFEQICYPFVKRGFYNNGNIVIFFNRDKKIKKLGSNFHMFLFIYIIYHEIRHVIQENVEGYEYFLANLEKYLCFAKLNEFNYKNNHDNFSYEIGANLYGIRKAKEYLINKHPKVYELEKERIEITEKYYMLDYYMYDASMTFDLAISIIRGRMIKNKSCDETIFMNSDGSFRRVRDILSNPIFNNLDERIVASVMSSRTFLKELNFEDLSYDELKALSLIVNYTNTIYHNQLKYLEKSLNEKNISNRLYLDKKSIVLKRAESLRPYIKNIELYMSIARYIEDRKK